MHCKACGSEIKLLSEQTRAADEGRTFTYQCPRCPVDISKFTREVVAPHVHISRSRISGKRPTPVLERLKLRKMFELHVRVKGQGEAPKGSNTALCYAALDTLGDHLKCYTSGPYAGMCTREVSRTSVGPLSWLVEYDVGEFERADVETHVGMKYRVIGNYMHTYDSGKRYAVAALPDSSTQSLCASLQGIYVSGYGPRVLSDFIPASVIGAMSNLTARGYDKNSDIQKGYLYSTKPDGERMWLTRVGLVWILSRRLTGHVCNSWVVDSTVDESMISKTGPCIDVEFMYFHRPILIDILMSESGVISSQRRTIGWIRSEMSRMKQLYPYLRLVYSRPFFETLEDAEAYRTTCPYPTDGIVAIHAGGVDMFKIKPIKSVELQVSSSGDLCTEEGNPLFKIDQGQYRPGSIVEVTFELKDSEIHVHRHFLRTDKRSANRLSAVRMILESAAPTDTSNLLRTRLWRWSNMVRTSIYERAYRMCRDKRILMDIGTGGGQSVESFQPGYSHILVEPDERSCVSLAKRLGVKRTDIKREPRSLIPLISRLKRTAVRFHILNCTLESILSDDIVVANIRGIIGCCVSSFSAHFVLDRVEDIREKCLSAFIGSCYMYDGVAVGSCIVDSSGITMRRISEDRATVQWGRDEVYEEPARESSDVPPDMVVSDAHREVPYSSIGDDDPGRRAVESLKILIYS